MRDRQSNMKHEIVLKDGTPRSLNRNQGGLEMVQQEMEYLNIGNENIEIVIDFAYLGSVINSNGNCS